MELKQDQRDKIHNLFNNVLDIRKYENKLRIDLGHYGGFTRQRLNKIENMGYKF